MCLAQLKSSRKQLNCCQEGNETSLLSEVSCIPVSLTVMGLVAVLEEVIKVFNESVEKV